ncbi:hypothetical protein SAMN04487989_101416 [Bizionia echini]|uniref:Prophage protein n=1 Tax=Bizionia echini TaxID=649333 RepID=A0A1I4Z067_9FLAO|nr:hypothetical protein [Bizionia echini]SFN43661.1 hypothetical protein SAMN04487989_101416 [Bizionia echini]
MKPTNQKIAFIPKLYCNMFGHDFEVSRKVTLHVKEYQCKKCKKQATTNGNGRLTELTPKFKEINSILEQIYTRRAMRLASNSYMETNLRITG